jgi:hypothetical protein
MLLSCIRKVGVSLLQTAPALLGLLTLAASPLQAQTNLLPITVGAGLKTSFVHADFKKNAGPSSDRFFVDNARLYVNGPVTDHIKFMFNTDYDSVSNKIGVLDAVARIEVKPEFNIWMGRLLPPSDRANLHGPFYAHHWAVYSDGIQNGHPAVYQGRDNGIVYWGDFAKKVKLSVGAFDGPSATGKSKLLTAARAQVDLWDEESGYYLNGNYYGDKDLLAFGVATQHQSGAMATTVDFLLEKKLSDGGVVSLESEYSNYNRLGGYVAGFKSQGAFGLASYMFAKKVGVGQFEILGKYAKAQFTQGPTPSFQQKTTEINFNYVIKQHNARVMSFFKDTRFNNANPDFWQGGVGVQIQM